MDQHFLNAPMKENIPIIMGLLGVWNSSFMGYNSRALIPYAQALLRLPAHIQQLDMEVRCFFLFLHIFVGSQSSEVTLILRGKQRSPSLTERE